VVSDSQNKKADGHSAVPKLSDTTALCPAENHHFRFRRAAPCIDPTFLELMLLEIAMEESHAQLEDVRLDRWGRVCSTVMRNQDISTAAKAVYSLLATYTDRNGRAWVSQDRLASDLGRSRSWVCGAIGELARFRVVEISHRFADGRQKSSVYEIHDGQTRKAAAREGVGDGVSRRDTMPDPASNTGVSGRDTEQDEDSHISLSAKRAGESCFDRLIERGEPAPAQDGPVPEIQPAPPADHGDVPLNWRPTPDDITWARARVPDLDADRFTETFVLSCRAKGYRYTDISSAWRRWLNEPKGRLPMLNANSRETRHDRTFRNPGSHQYRGAPSRESAAEIKLRNDAAAADCLGRILARRAGAGCGGSPA
jgi:hypothetical protein